jgi:hypothetical protein
MITHDLYHTGGAYTRGEPVPYYSGYGEPIMPLEPLGSHCKAYYADMYILSQANLFQRVRLYV